MQVERIKKIKLPNSLQTIEKYAFARCLSLDEISLPASIQKIGIQAFIGCISLRLVILPPKVEVENNAFDLCKNVCNKRNSKVTLIAYILRLLKVPFTNKNLRGIFLDSP